MAIYINRLGTIKITEGGCELKIKGFRTETET